MKIFLGGTVNHSKWRETLIPLLKIAYFNPVVPIWDEAAYQRELHERATCDFILYVITPKATGFYSIAELIDDSNKRPQKTIFVLLEEDEGEKFSPHQMKSLKKTGTMVVDNGAIWLPDLPAVARHVNGTVPSA